MSEPLLFYAQVLDQTVSMRRGTSRLVIIKVVDEDGNAVDLTNCTAKWWVGLSVTSTGQDVVIMKSTSGGIAIIKNADGFWYLNVTVNPADTENLAPRLSYYHEAEVTDQANNVYVVASGSFDLLPALTT